MEIIKLEEIRRKKEVWLLVEPEGDAATRSSEEDRERSRRHVVKEVQAR